MAKISRKFHLGKSQYELDFVDIDPKKDKPLFINPFFLSTRTDAFSTEASRTVKNFFHFNLELIRSGQKDQARNNFIHLNEPNETCLGMSLGKPSGRGMGAENSDDLFKSIAESEAVNSGLLEDLEDSAVFIDGIGRDKVSDMTTNLIRRHLIIYTQEQSEIHGIPLTPNAPSGFFWDPTNKRWESELTEMLIVDDKIVLLIPKAIVSFSREYTPDKYHRHFALTYLQADHIRRGTHLVRKSYDKKGVLKKERVTKKDLIERELPFAKVDLLDFTGKHPEVFRKFREDTAKKEVSLENQDIGTDITIREVADYLIAELNNVQPGDEQAQQYHKLMFGVLELLFYPQLINPGKEREINEGRKRVDIVFDNGASLDGFFYRLQHVMEIPCQYIFVECKNYSKDVANPEVDQLIARFSINKGKFGVITCRGVQDMPLLIARCRDAYQAGQGLVIPITDEDLVAMLKKKGTDGEEARPEEEFFTTRAKEIIL